MADQVLPESERKRTLQDAADALDFFGTNDNWVELSDSGAPYPALWLQWPEYGDPLSNARDVASRLRRLSRGEGEGDLQAERLHFTKALRAMYELVGSSRRSRAHELLTSTLEGRCFDCGAPSGPDTDHERSGCPDPWYRR